MGKLIFKIHGIEFEYIGEPSEIERFIQRVVAGAEQFSSSQSRLTGIDSPLISQAVFSATARLERQLPDDEYVKKFITSKRDFRHNLFEIQESLFGVKFKSRGETISMYHKTARQARRVRKDIEREYDGRFEETFGEGGVKEFVFKKNPNTNERIPNRVNR